MGDKDFDNFNLQIGEIIGMTLDGKAIYRFTELGTAKNVMFGESIFKDGDFVVNEFGSILILKETRDGFVFDHAYLPACGELTIDKVAGYGGIERHATEEEKQKMLDALAKRGRDGMPRRNALRIYRSASLRWVIRLRLKTVFRVRHMDTYFHTSQN